MLELISTHINIMGIVNGLEAKKERRNYFMIHIWIIIKIKEEKSECEIKCELNAVAESSNACMGNRKEKRNFELKHDWI